MFDLSAEDLLNWFNLLWAIFGVAVLWIAKRLHAALNVAYKNYTRMTKVILGDGEDGTPGIDERLGAIETRAAVHEQHRLNSSTLVDDLAYIKKELTHNGGTSVKDMARDAAINSRKTLVLMRARDDMDTTTAYFISDEDGEYSWVSETFLAWTKFQQQDLLGFGWMNAVFPEDRVPVRQEWDNAVADDRDFLMEFRMWTRTREPFWVRALAKKVPGMNGAATGWYGSIQLMTPEDITQNLADITE